MVPYNIKNAKAFSAIGHREAQIRAAASFDYAGSKSYNACVRLCALGRF